jgi:hypothetical protein
VIRSRAARAVQVFLPNVWLALGEPCLAQVRGSFCRIRVGLDLKHLVQQGFDLHNANFIEAIIFTISSETIARLAHHGNYCCHSNFLSSNFHMPSASCSSDQWLARVIPQSVGR